MGILDEIKEAAGEVLSFVSNPMEYTRVDNFSRSPYGPEIQKAAGEVRSFISNPMEYTRVDNFPYGPEIQKFAGEAVDDFFNIGGVFTGSGGFDPSSNEAISKAGSIQDSANIQRAQMESYLQDLADYKNQDTVVPSGTPPTQPTQPTQPALSVQDILRAAQANLLSSQLEGFGEQRDLIDSLAAMREAGLASQERFASQTASDRTNFVEDLDERRAVRFEQAAAEREQRKTVELARQQTQLDDALRAVDIDTGAAGDRLRSLGIDPGSFANQEMSDTTAMLYSQNMSAANMVNMLDGVAVQAANFAKDANDQASAAALYGIKEDLSFALQAVDQMRQQGLMDDAMAMQAIADAERQAQQATEMTYAQLDVDTLEAAQAVAARQAAAASSARKTELGAAALGILANIQQGGYVPTQQDLMIISEAKLGDAFLDIGNTEADFYNDLVLKGGGSGADTGDMLKYLQMRVDAGDDIDLADPAIAAMFGFDTTQTNG
jgi:hypothetical protein